MSAWPLVPLGQVLRMRSEIVHPRDNPRGEGRFVGLEHIEPHTGRRIGELAIRLEELTGRKARFRRDDIVYGYLRPYLNKVWVADFDGYCSVDQYVFEVDLSVADRDFVSHFMRSEAYLSQAPIDQTPGQLPRIRTEEIMSVLMPLPPVAEQHRVAAGLTAQLESAVSAHDNSVVQVGLAVESRSLVMSTVFDDLEASSGRLRLSETGSLQDGDWILTADYAPAGIRLLQVGDIGRGELLLKSNRFITKDRARELRCTQLRTGDVLISRMADPMGRACLLPQLETEAITAVDVTIYRPRTDLVDPEFIVQYMNSSSWLTSVASHSSGATRPRISRRNMERLEVPLPSLSEQRRVSTSLRKNLATIDAMTAAIAAELRAIDALPAALLRRAFDELVA